MIPNIDTQKLERLRLQADLNSAAQRGASDLYIAARQERDDCRAAVVGGLSRDAGRKWESGGFDPYELLMLEADEQKRIGASVPALHALLASVERLGALAHRVEAMQAEHAPFAQMVARFNAYAEGKTS